MHSVVYWYKQNNNRLITDPKHTITLTKIANQLHTDDYNNRPITNTKHTITKIEPSPPFTAEQTTVCLKWLMDWRISKLHTGPMQIPYLNHMFTAGVQSKPYWYLPRCGNRMFQHTDKTPLHLRALPTWGHPRFTKITAAESRLLAGIVSSRHEMHLENGWVMRCDIFYRYIVPDHVFLWRKPWHY